MKESHGNAINDAKFTKAAHALCAKQNSEKTPVLKTTGERDAVTGRKKLTRNDVLCMKRSMDALKVPSAGRRLVLCSDHINDLWRLSRHSASSTISTAMTEPLDACMALTSTSLLITHYTPQLV